MLSSRVKWRSFYLNLIVTILIATGAIRICDVYRVYNQTFDEPAHLARGIEAVQRGTYRFESLHPPLAATIQAIGPYLDGARLTGSNDMWEEGNAILYGRDRYWRTLTLARLGTLPFFIASALVMFCWVRAVFDDATAIAAVLLYTTLPPVLGHSSLATTDMALASTLFVAVVAFGWWLARPTPRRSVAAGLLLSLPLLSKVSSVVFFPACALCYIAAWRIASGHRGGLRDQRRLSQWIVPATIFLSCVLLGLWAGYRFTYHSLLDPAGNPDLVRQTLDSLAGTSGVLHDIAYAIASFEYFPAPEFVLGFGSAAFETVTGRAAYLLGESRPGGWWYFYPVALLVKTPIAMLLLVGAGIVAILRDTVLNHGRIHALAMLLCATAICVLGVFTKVQIGLRHLLPIYPFLVIVAAIGIRDLLRMSSKRPIVLGALVALVGWHVWAGVRTHPDYLPYFNEIASNRPEHFLLNSDLDWGQDLDRLNNELLARGVDMIHLRYFGTAIPQRHINATVFPLASDDRPHGWIAVSVFTRYDGFHPELAWLDQTQRVTRVGRSIDLYLVAEHP